MLAARPIHRFRRAGGVVVVAEPENVPDPGALRRVLMIEDSDVDAELLRLRLLAAYPRLEAVRWVSQPDRVLQEVAAFVPDIVITDYHVPGLDVLAMLAALRQRWPELPLVVISGLVGEEAAIKVFKAGASDFLPKSRSERLTITIDRAMSEASHQRAQRDLLADLERERQVNEAIVDHVQAGLWIMDATGTITRTNRHGRELMAGFKEIDVEGFGTIEGWWADTGQKISAHEWPGARAFERREHVAPTLIKVRNFAGEERYFACGAAPLQAADDSLMGAVISAMDVSEEVEVRRRLELAEKRLRELSLRLVRSHEDRLTHVSRELHDNLGQQLSLLKLQLGAAARPGTPAERQAAALHDALGLVDRALLRLREVCGELQPSELVDFGLLPALRAMADRAGQAAQVPVRVSEEGARQPLGSDIATGLFRVAQQALTNALHHAQAPDVEVRLLWLGDEVSVTIADQGVGFDGLAPSGTGQHGLRNMQERMELLGGSLSLWSSPGAGTTVTARVACIRDVLPARPSADAAEPDAHD
jgi:two-component system, NarL family, sensor histidine kinase UhpB